MKKYTMSDIARAAGISRQTASDVLNKKDVIKVSQKTKDRIWRLVEEMNYQPNYLSRSLKKGKTDIIGVGTIAGTLDMFDHIYTAKIFNGIGRYFFSTNYKLLFQNINEDRNAPQIIDLLKSRLIDGMIIVLYSSLIDEFNQKQAPLLKKAGVPFVAIHSTTRTLDYHNIGANCRAGAQEAVRHLAGHGYKTIGCVRQNNPVGHEQELAEGYTAAVAECGLTDMALPELTDPVDQRSFDTGYAWAAQVLARKTALPRALFVMEDRVANGIMKKFAEAGINVPADVAIISYGNEGDQTSLYNDLTTTTQPAKAKGFRAGEFMGRIINAAASSSMPMAETMALELIVRKSCGCR
jgi:LacI family transcriptional regulator